MSAVQNVTTAICSRYLTVFVDFVLLTKHLLHCTYGAIAAATVQSNLQQLQMR